jgi:uncharacterized protein involved in outer membrane biogenesis
MSSKILSGRSVAVVALAAVVLLPLLLLAGLVVLAQSEWGERWFESQVSGRIKRDVEVDNIRVKLRWPLELTMEKLRISNPDWANTPDLLNAEGLRAQVGIAPLFKRRIVVPFLSARKAAAGLERDGERATWRFGHDQRSPSRIELAKVSLDDGNVVYRDEDEKTALRIAVAGSLGEQGELKLSASGQFRGEATKASARIPSLDPNPTEPIQIEEGEATIGKTQISASGTIGSRFSTLDLQMRVAGNSLNDLDKYFSMVLPETPPYTVAGHLTHAETEWVFNPFEGKVGDSDIAGNATYRKQGKRPILVAKVHSKVLDLDDLGPLVGAPPKTGPAETANAQQRQKAIKVARSSKLFPRTKFNTERWDAMDADVQFDAKRVLRPKQLPIDSLSSHLTLTDGVVRIDPLNFGMAGGRFTSVVTLDGREKPMRGEVDADVQGLQLRQLFPNLESMEEALGTLYGHAKLSGRGNSVAALLGTSNGAGSFAVEGGRISQLLVELLEIDVAKAALLVGTRKETDLRCAAANLSVKDGVATPDSFVVDTDDTFVKVEGNVSLEQETLDLVTRAKGKKPSLFVLRAPVVMEGPLKKPKIHPRAGPIVAQAAAAVALGAVNPALAIAPFLDPGSDDTEVDCGKLLAESKATGAVRASGQQ